MNERESEDARKIVPYLDRGATALRPRPYSGGPAPLSS